MRIDYRPMIGNGVGNETPFTIGNPYRRIRYDGNGWFILVKGKRVATQTLFGDWSNDSKAF